MDRLPRAALAGLALATFGSFLAGWAWWLDVLSDFRVQYAAAAALLALAALAMRRMKEMVLALALLGLNGIALAPHLAPAPDGPATMKVIGFNLDFHNTDTAPTLDFLRRENADVVVVTEVTEVWRSALDRLSDIYSHRFFGPLCRCPGKTPHTIGLLAKRPWEDIGVERSDLTNRVFAVWARFPSASPSLTVAGVHIMNPINGFAVLQRAETEALVSVVKRFKGPLIVVGDFNMTPFSTRYEALLRKSGLRRADGGLNTTWPALLTPLGLSLDHVLVGAGIRDAAMRTGPRLGSDHLPVVGTFNPGT